MSFFNGGEGATQNRWRALYIGDELEGKNKGGNTALEEFYHIFSPNFHNFYELQGNLERKINLYRKKHTKGYNY